MCSCRNLQCRKHSLAMSLYGAVNVATSIKLTYQNSIILLNISINFRQAFSKFGKKRLDSRTFCVLHTAVKFIEDQRNASPKFSYSLRRFLQLIDT